MNLAYELQDLQKWANYNWLRSTLRAAGIGSIIFGAIGILVGLPGQGSTFWDMGFLLIGVTLFVEGIWITRSPSPPGIIADGIVLIMLGGWNIASTIHDGMTAGHVGASRHFVLLGIWQVIWGLERFGRYSTFAKLPIARPQKHIRRWLDATTTRVFKAGTASSSDVITFSANEGKKDHTWNGLLMDGVALFAGDNGKRLLAVRKEEVDFSAISQGEQSRPIRYTIGDVTGEGTISAESMKRFEEWKRPSSVEEPGLPATGRLADAIHWNYDQAVPEPVYDVRAAKFAGFWRRFGANLIDTVVTSAGMGAAWFIVFAIALAVAGKDDVPESYDSVLRPILLAIIVLVPLLYYGLMESSSKRGTLGKMALGMAVVDCDGCRISFWRALSRHLSKAISAVVLFIGFILAGVTERKQALHDFIAGTMVVDRKSAVKSDAF